MKITPRRIVSVAVIIVLVMGIYSWWHWIYSSPSHVFNRMISSSFATPGIAKQVLQDDGQGQKLDQSTQLLTTPEKRVRSLSTLTEGTNAATKVITESVGSADVDYVRYTSIKTDQKNAQGGNFNFAKVLGVWGKASNADSASGGAQLFNQTLLGVLPIGNLNAADRKELVKQAIDSGVYKIDYSSIKRQIVAGRPTYSYDVTVQPVPYVTLLKSFAHDIGLKQLDRVDPNQYKDSQALKFTLDVDVWSGQLKKIAYQDSNRTEIYSGYGLRANVDLPTASIPVQDLQTRLQEVQ